MILLFRPERRTGTLIRALLGSVAIVMAVAPERARAASATAPAGNQIVPTGRTATTLTVNGSVTEVTTGTVTGGNAYNDFSRFSTVSGTTVNLQVPGGANNLVNVVRDAPAVVNGVVNSYKGGKIGGNVVFADPYGFVVGESGVVNVGSLTVRTPTKAFLDQLIGPTGAISGAAAAALQSGDIPVSPDGLISIRGKVNAAGRVLLAGHTVEVGRDPAAVQAAKFAATVNQTGLRTGAAIVSRHGGIDIVAAGDAAINGRLATGARAGRNAGAVRVTAAHNVRLGASANIDTHGVGAHSSGGDIVVRAGQDLALQAGATFQSFAGASGDGGQIEISAVGTESLAGGTYNAGATTGKAGSVSFDPGTLEISGVTTTLNGTGYVATGGSITVDAGAVIVTRQVAGGANAADPTVASTGNSGNITLSLDGSNGASGVITIKAGAQLLAFATDASAAGNITLDAGTTGTVAFATDANLVASAVLATRVIASGTGASLTGSVSTGNSGNITLRGAAIQLGSGINTAGTSSTAPGEQLLANAAAPSTCVTAAACAGFTPGTIEFDVAGSYAFNAAAPVLTQGANLVVDASGTVTFGAGSLINTRHQAPQDTETADGVTTTYFSPTDPTSAILDTPGNVTVTAGGVAFQGGLNVTGGAAIYAGGYGGARGFLPGTIAVNVPSLSVSGTIASAGANLTLNASTGALTVAAGTVLTTREVAAGADPTSPTVASANVSGDLVLTAAHGDVVIGAQAKLLTFATDSYYAGDITLSAGGSVVFTAPTAGQTSAELVARSISSTAADAATAGFYAASTADSGNVNVSAGPSGSIELNGGLNDGVGPTVLAGAAVAGSYAYAAGTITFSAPSIALGSGMSYKTLGANLVLDGAQSVSLAPGATINTRDVAAGANPIAIANVSTENSGAVTLAAPSITLAAGSTIDTSAVGACTLAAGSVAAAPGNVSIGATTTLVLASGASGNATIASRGVAAGASSIAGGSADASGADITLAAPSIDLSNGLNGAQGATLLAAGGAGLSAGTIALTENSIDLSTTLGTLGANVSLTAKTGNVTLENSAVIDTTANGVPAGNITLAGTSIVLPNNALNASGSATLRAVDAGGAGTITFSETADLDFTTAHSAQHPSGSTLDVQTGGASFILQTAGTLSLGANLTIDTRDMANGAAAGPAGDIGLSAGTIAIGGGLNGGSGTATLLASAGSGYAPGTILLQWTGSEAVTLNSGASFNSAGANLAFDATGDISIADATTINAGSNTATVLGNTVQIAPTAVFDASAAKLGETSASANFELSSSASFAGINLTIATATSIVIDAGATLSTRKTSNPFGATPNASTGNSGSITLEAPVITVLGTLDAGVINANGTAYAGGDVTLEATQLEQPVSGFGNTTATTTIALGNAAGVAATIKGANVQLLAAATSDSEPFSTIATGEITLGTTSVLQVLGQINGTVQLATATSEAHVYGGATIAATGDVVVQASSNTTASDTTPETAYFLSVGLSGTASGFGPSASRLVGNPLNAAFAVMEATSTANAYVDAGATVSAGGIVTVRAHNTDLIHADESIISTNNTVDLALAYSSATINSTAVIANGATVNAGAVRVVARNDNEWETAAEVADMGQGKGGIVLALSENDTSNATAQMNADLTLSSTLPAAADAGLLVEAQSLTTSNVVSASAESGSGDMAASALGKIGGNTDGLASALNSKTGGDLNNVFSNNSSTQEQQIRFAFGVALNLGNEQSATATIGGSAGGTAPTIDSPAGPVAVIAEVTDSGVQTQALSTIRSTTYGKDSTSFPGTSYGFGGAVALTDLSHDADAEIGVQANVTAPAVAVDSTVFVPLSLPIADWGTPNAILTNITSLLPTALENSTAEVDTTGANAVANAQQLGVAGSVDIFTLNDHATAWVDQGAIITATPGSSTSYAAGNWSVATGSDGDDKGGFGPAADDKANFTSTVSIAASDTVAAINIGGGIDILGVFHPAKSSSSTAGAAFSETDFAQTTQAGIANAVTVDTSGSLAVEANALDFIITLVPSATNAGQLALSGMVGLSILDNTTEATISDTAAITADTGLTLHAEQELNSSVVGGALFQIGSTVAFGVGIGINLPTADTEAFIGDNSAIETAIDPTAALASGFLAPTASVSAPSVTVFALTSGQVLSLGLAGSLAKSDSDGHEAPTNTSASTGTGNFTSHEGIQSVLDRLAVLDGVLPDWPTGPELPELPEFGLAVSGSAAVVEDALTTKADLQSAKITDSGTSANDTINVSAVRNLWLVAGAGGFAATVSDSAQTNVGIAGALAADISKDVTDAYIAGNSSVSGFNTVQVAALEGGQQIDVGIDLALNLAEGGQSVGVAVSASIGLVNDSVGAWIDGSTITGQGTGTGAASVVAYDDTNIGLGGGAFLVNVGADGGGSAGLGLTVGLIGDPSGGKAVNAYVNNATVESFKTASVEAASASRIIMGAVSGSVSSQSSGVGAVTYADIGTTTSAAVTGGSEIDASTVSVLANAGDQASDDSQLAQYGRVAYSSISDFSGSSVLSVLDSGAQGTAPTKIGTGGAAIIAVAGTIGIGIPSGSAGANANVGLQLTIDDVADTYAATVSDSTITTPGSGSVTVAANDSATILAISAGAAITASSSDSFNLTGLGSLTINLNSDTATATVGDAMGSQYGTSISTGSLSVTANNAAITDGFAGNVDISTGTNSAAFGAAIAFGQDKQTTSALLTNSALNVAGETAVLASTNPVCAGNGCPVVPYTIADAAFTVAGSGDLAFGGAITANVVENATTARASAISLNDPNVWATAYPQAGRTSLVVEGSDNSTVATLAVSVAAAQTAGVGAGISYGDMANTVTAAIDGDNGTGQLTPAIDVGSVLVQATSTPNIKTLAAGVAGGQNVGIGGSIVTNFVGLTPSLTPVATATATIDQGAVVSALGNVYVLADDDSSIQVIAGSLGVSAGGEPGLGLGLGVVFNDIQTAAKAEVANSSVDAQGQNGLTAGGVRTVDDGSLKAGAGNAPDVSTISAPQATTYALAENQKVVHGLAVDATAAEQVIADTVSVGFQASEEPGAGIGANVLVNIMGGSTTADITGSNIDTLYGVQPVASGVVQPDVFVNASSHAFAGDFVAAVAASGYVGLAGAADAGSVSRTTTADISGGQIGSVIDRASLVTNPYNGMCTPSGCDDSSDTLTTTTLTPIANIGTVTVNAATTADTADIVIGAAGSGIASGAGSVAVDIFDPTTTAYVSAGTPVVANNLTVAATTGNGNNMLGGAAAAGGTAGAGSFGILVSEDTTNAYVGDQANQAVATTLTLTGTLSVQSAMTDNFNSLIVSGAGGGSVGVAGMADVLVVTNATTSGLYLVDAGATGAESSTTSAITQPTAGAYAQTVTNQYGNSASLLTAPISVSVDATETLNIAANAGALGIGGSAFGLGAGAGVIVLKSNTTAVAAGDILNTTGTVQVDATSTKTIQATAVSLGAGGTAGIGASALLILVGSAPSGALNDILSELNASGSGTLSKADMASSSNSGASDPTGTPMAPTYSVTDTINNASNDAVTASIEGGAITASAIDVIATSSISTSSIVGGAGLGGTLGLGGGVGYTLIYDTVTATLYGGTFETNSITVDAIAQDATPALTNYPGSANVLAIAGGAGLVGLGAAYANGTIDDTVSASVGGMLGTASSLALVNGGCTEAQTTCLSVAATDAATDTVGAYGAEVGAAAAGVVVGQAYKTSSVSASVLNGSVLSGFSTTTIDATQGGALTADTVGAAGGLLAAGTGAASTALTLTQVTASTGTNVTLPDGDVSLIARNNPTDMTSALGVAAGGYFAAGVGVAESDAGDDVSDTSQPVDATTSIYTAATLGSGTITDASRTGALNLSAASVSVVAASGTAGAGGGVAGAAAVGKTNDTALTVVTLNDPTGTLYAGAVTVTSNHTTNFAGQSNAIAAAVVGGSGAETDNGGDISTSAVIGTNSKIVATGAVTISASDSLAETVSGDVASAAAGGVLSGSAVLASSTYTLGAKISLGNNVSIASGTDPVSNPGALAIGAGILVAIGDTASLNTGGVLDGASVSNAVTLTPTTDVEIGSNDTLFSDGGLGIGSFIQVEQAAPDAYANTYGLAAVGAASSTVTITADQTTHVGSETSINGLGSVWVTAGLDPSGSIPTIVNGAPNATAYAYGLVGVPDTHATATLVSTTSLTIDRGAAIDSALNVTLGGYPGAPYASPVASGNGDVLGVPTTSGDSTANTSSSAVVTMNGSALAGEYNTLLITVDPSQCDASRNCLANEIEGRPTTITYDPSENLVPLIDTDFPTDPAHSAALAGVPSIGTPTVTIGTLYAAGGLVYLNASQLSGNGSLTANGGPSITVNNPTDATLVFGQIEIPAQAGGSVIFTGAANAQSDHALRVTTSASNIGQVTINSTGSGTTGGVPPDLIFGGGISAITGNVSINNSYGSIATANSVIAISATLTAPNGIETIGNGTTPEYLAGNPFSEWDATIVYPGGNPSNGTPDANVAAAYAANAIDGSFPGLPASAYSGLLYGTANGNSSTSGIGSSSTYKYVSQVWFGNCLPAAGGDCSAGTASAISQELGAGNGNYAIDPNGGPNYYYFALVPTENLNPTAQVVPNTAAFTNAMGGIEARQITIQGSYIAIAGDLILGSPTTVSIDIPSSELPLLAALHGANAAPYTLITDASNNPLVTYNGAQNQIVVANINAAATASQLLLDGQILGTNPNAQISVNTGLGTATITNETGVPLTLGNINAGSDATNLTSTVQIVDTLTQTNNVYRYTTGQGLQHLETSDLSMFCTAGTDCTNGAAFSNTNAATFTPQQGTELDWSMSAEIKRSASGGVYSNWSFVAPPGTTNPWQYASGNIVNGNPAATLSTGTPPGDLPLTTAFAETITGSQTSASGTLVYYHGCGSDNCHYDFPANSSQTDGNGGNGWVYWFPTDATLTLAMRVKADYAFGISFGGSTTGSIAVTSNSPITVGGTLFNPNGTTTLTSTGSNATATLFGLTSATGDGIYASNGASIAAGTLTLTTTGAIGTATLPVPVAMTRDPDSATSGVLAASAGSAGINLAIQSAATLGNISASDSQGYGNVNISAQSDLVAQQGVSIAGRNITIDVASGGLGTSGGFVDLTPNGHGGASGGLVNIAALGSIFIERDGGDLLAGTIASQGGDVSIAIPNGSLLDASAETPLSVLTSTQVTAITNHLGLTADGEAGASVLANTVNPTQATVDGYYASFWNLKDTLLPNGTVSGTLYAAGSTFAVAPNSAAYAIYAPLAQQNENQRARAAGTAPATVTQADVEAYVDSLYQTIVTQYAPAFAQFYGANWQTAASFTTQSAAPTVFPTSAGAGDTRTTVAELEVSSNQNAAALLNSAVSYNALQPAGTTIIGIGTPNVVGHSVTVTEATAVGRLGTPVKIPFASILSGNLTTAQSEALGLATAPGQAAFEVVTPGGRTLSIPITQLSLVGSQYYYTPSGGTMVPVTPTNVVITEPAPLFVAVNGSLNVVAQGAVYAQSTIPDLPVGTVLAQGAVSLSAPEAITSALTGNSTNIRTSGGGVSLATESGSIGSASQAITISVSNAPTTGALTAVSAGRDAYLNYVGGDLTIGSVFANGAVSIKASSDVYAAGTGVNVTADSIALVAQGAIGTSTAALEVEVGSGALSGSARGNAYFDSPSVGTQAAAPFTVNGFTADDVLSLVADGSVLASHVTAKHGALTVASGNDVTLESALAVGTLMVTAAGDITVGDLTTQGAGHAIELTAGALGILTVEANAAVQSSDDLTTSSASLVMQADATLTAGAAVDLTTTAGDAVLGDVLANDGNLIVLVSGSAGRILSNGDVGAVLSVQHAGEAMTLTAGGDIGAATLPLVVTTASLAASSQHGGIWIEGQGDLVATSLSAQDGAIDVTATGVLTAAHAVAGQTLTLMGATGLNAGTVSSIGNASLTATRGNIVLTGSLVSQAGAAFDAAQGSATLPDAMAATFLTAHAAMDIAAGTLRSGGVMTLDGGAVTLASLTTTGGGDIDVTAALTDIDGHAPGAIDSSGGVTLFADLGGISLPSIKARSVVSVTAGAVAQVSTIQSGGTATLTGGELLLGTLTTTGEGGDPGDLVIDAGQGGVTAGATRVAGATHISSGGDVTLTTITSGGSITAQGAGAIAFQVLTSQAATSDVDLTATGLISGQTVLAGRDSDLTSTGGAVDVAAVTAVRGAVEAKGEGDVTLATVQAATTFKASSHASLMLGTATSGGTQTLGADGAIGFVQLTSTVTVGDAGDIGLNAGGAITGRGIQAANNVDLTSTGATIDIATVTAALGGVAATGEGDITLPSVTAATTFVAYGADLRLGSAMSGGTQTLGAGGTIAFVQLISTGMAGDPGNIEIEAGGAISGQGIQAANDADLISTGATIDVDAVTAARGAVNATGFGDLTLPNVTAATAFVANGADLMLGTALSGGTQTLGAVGTIGFVKLTSTGPAGDPGNIGLNAGGAISGGVIEAVSSVGLTSTGATIDVDAVTAVLGGVAATAKGDVTLPSVTAAMTFVANGADLLLGTAHTGGTQMLGAAGAIGFAQLTSTGTAGDPGDIGLEAGGAISGQGIQAANDARLTSTGATIDVDTVTAVLGGVAATGKGDVTLPSVTSATTFVANGADLVLGTALSGGAQTLGAGGTIGFVQLTSSGTAGDPGDIGLKAGGAITGSVIKAARNVGLASTGATIDVDTVTALLGGVAATGKGDVTLPNVQAATTFAANGADLGLGRALSGGTQTLRAGGTIGFVQLTSTGMAGDPGNIGLTSGGAISGHVILAAGSAALLSRGGTVQADSVTAATGGVSATGLGDVMLPNVSAATTFAASTGADLVLGTAVSGGTQTLDAGGEVRFAQLTTLGLPNDPGDVDITAVAGPILGGNIDAAGSVFLNGHGIGFGTILAGLDGTLISSNGLSGGQVSAGNNISIQSGPGDLDLGAASGRSMDLEAGHQIAIGQLTVRDGLILRAQIVDGTIDQTADAMGPLSLEVTGPQGNLALDVDLKVGAPRGLQIPTLAAVDARLVTTATTLAGQFDVLDTMLLQTADTTLLLDNTNPELRPGVDVQLYQPGGAFFLAENGTVSATNAFVVSYLQDYQTFSAAFTDGHVDAYPEFDGTSASRDAAWNTAQDLRRAESATDDDETSLRLLLAGLRYPGLLVTTKPGVIGPAVNLNR